MDLSKKFTRPRAYPPDAIIDVAGDDASPTMESITMNSVDHTTLETSDTSDERTIFVGDIPLLTTIADLQELFNGLSFKHTEIKVINGQTAKGPVVYAFITFSTVQVAELAIAKVKDTMTVTFADGTVARVGWAARNCRLHVSNLDQSTTEADLVGLYAKYGRLSETDPVVIIKKPSNNPLLSNSQIICYGVVSFASRDDTESAKNATHNTYFGGRKLRVDWNRPSTKHRTQYFRPGSVSGAGAGSGSGSGSGRDSQSHVLSQGEEQVRTTAPYCTPPSAPSAPDVISIYVQFEVSDMNVCVTEETLFEIFGSFGNMTGAYLKTLNMSVLGTRQHGYAFVHFRPTPEGKQSALAAARISREGPYVHNGCIMVHAELSKNFKRAATYATMAEQQDYRDDGYSEATTNRSSYGSVYSSNPLPHYNPPYSTPSHMPPNEPSFAPTQQGYPYNYPYQQPFTQSSQMMYPQYPPQPQYQQHFPPQYQPYQQHPPTTVMYSQYDTGATAPTHPPTHPSAPSAMQYYSPQRNYYPPTAPTPAPAPAPAPASAPASASASASASSSQTSHRSGSTVHFAPNCSTHY